MSGGADARTVAKIVIADDSCDSKLAEVFNDAARMGEIKAVCREFLLPVPRAWTVDDGTMTPLVPRWAPMVGHIHKCMPRTPVA